MTTAKQKVAKLLGQRGILEDRPQALDAAARASATARADELRAALKDVTHATTDATGRARARALMDAATRVLDIPGDLAAMQALKEARDAYQLFALIFASTSSQVSPSATTSHSRLHWSKAVQRRRASFRCKSSSCSWSDALSWQSSRYYKAKG